MCQHVNKHHGWYVPIASWSLVSFSQCNRIHHYLFTWTFKNVICYHRNPLTIKTTGWAPPFLCYRVRFRRYDAKYNSVMAESKTAAMATTWRFGNGSMVRAPNCKTVPSFMLLWQSEWFVCISSRLFRNISVIFTASVWWRTMTMTKKSSNVLMVMLGFLSRFSL